MAKNAESQNTSKIEAQKKYLQSEIDSINAELHRIKTSSAWRERPVSESLLRNVESEEQKVWDLQADLDKLG